MRKLNIIFKPPTLLMTLAIWFAAEFLALMMVVHWVGWLGAITLGLAISFLGFRQLSSLGRGAAQNLQVAMARGSVPQTNMVDGLLAAFGAVLMILPGFLSDFIGIALTAPSLRQWIARSFNGRLRKGKRGKDDVIDLAPEDWRPIEHPKKASPTAKN